MRERESLIPAPKQPGIPKKGIPAGPKKAPPEPPSLGRALLLAGLVLAAIGACFWTLLKLTGRIE